MLGIPYVTPSLLTDEPGRSVRLPCCAIALILLGTGAEEQGHHPGGC